MQGPPYVAPISIRIMGDDLDALRTVAVDIEMESIIPHFQHHNLERMARVTSDVEAGYQTEQVANNIIEKLDQYSWPEGLKYLVGGEQENRKKSFGGMLQALLIHCLRGFNITGRHCS